MTTDNLYSTQTRTKWGVPDVKIIENNMYFDDCFLRFITMAVTEFLPNRTLYFGIINTTGPFWNLPVYRMDCRILNLPVFIILSPVSWGNQKQKNRLKSISLRTLYTEILSSTLSLITNACFLFICECVLTGDICLCNLIQVDTEVNNVCRADRMIDQSRKVW